MDRKPRKIPFSPPDVTEAEANEVRDAILSGWITTGPRTKELERRLSLFCNTPKTVCLNSATAALEMALRLLGIGPGDEVIVPAYTYTATASVISHVGATIVMVDSQSDGVEMDYEQLAAAVTERTKAIMPVDVAGICADIDRVMEIVTRPDIAALFRPANDLQRLIGRVAVCCDCAHSLGATRHGRKAGEMADFSSFSFHAVKNLTTAEGGALTWHLPFGGDIVGIGQRCCGIDVPQVEGETWDELLYRLCQLLSLHGQNKDALAKTRLGAWEYDIIGPWYKCNMTDIMASIGLVQLSRYPDMLAKRQQYVAYMDSMIDRINSRLPQHRQIARLCHSSASHSSSRHLYIIRLQGLTREEANNVIVQMAEMGVATNVHYKPLPMMTAYKSLGFDISDYPNAYRLYENAVTLPLNTRMTMDDVAYVMDCLAEVVLGTAQDL